jgi:hypothetical protein
MAKSDDAKPYVVTTDAGVFRSGHDSQENADYACAEANKQAEALEIKTRYVAQPR